VSVFDLLVGLICGCVICGFVWFAGGFDLLEIPEAEIADIEDELSDVGAEDFRKLMRFLKRRSDGSDRSDDGRERLSLRRLLRAACGPRGWLAAPWLVFGVGGFLMDFDVSIGVW